MSPKSRSGRATIAAVIPAFNAAAFITEALESIRVQSRPPDQIIVVDDGSTDETFDEVSQWSRRRGVQVDVIRKVNGGLPSARNAGIRAAEVDYVALLDADDVWVPSHVETLLSLIRRNSGAVLAFGDAVGFRNGKTVKQSYLKARADLAWRQSASGDRVLCSPLLSLVSGSFIPNCATLFSRSAAIAAGLYDESFLRVEDCDFWLRLSRQGEFVFTDDVVARVRFHGSNISSNALLMSRYFFRCLAKARRELADVRLTVEEQSGLAGSIAARADEYLYHASRRGVREFVSAMKEVARELPPKSGVSRHALRALAASAGLVR